MPLRSAYRNKKAFSGKKTRRINAGLFSLILSCLVSLACIQLYSTEGDTGFLHRVKSLSQSAVSPISRVGAFISSPFRSKAESSSASLSSESVQELEEQNTKLRRAVEELEEYKQESERLRGLLQLSSAYQLQSSAARVIGRSQDAWSRTITIDKGSSNGFSSGMPVLNSYGLIGQIEQLNANNAVVRLISDEKSGVSAMIQSNRAAGILRGSADGSLRLDYITTDAEVKPGDVVITSGMGGVYPKGLPIGEVISVERSAASLYYNIVVRPPRASASYEEVLVITKLNDPDKQPIASSPSEADNQAADEQAARLQADPSAQSTQSVQADQQESPALQGQSQGSE